MPDFQRPARAQLPLPRPRPRPDLVGPGFQRPGPGLGPGNGARNQDLGRGGQLGQSDAALMVAPQAQASAESVVDELMLDAAGTACIAVVPQELRSYAEGHIPTILDTAARSGLQNANQVAYILATAEHESKFGHPAFSWSEPLVEDHNQYSQNKKGKWHARDHVHDQRVTGDTEEALDQDYWDAAYGGRLGNEEGTADASQFRGRGYVQLTGRDNYQKMSDKLGREGFTYTLDGVTWGSKEQPIDLVTHFDHVNRSKELAAKLLVEGCVDGDYTGKKLGDYVNDEGTDFKDARAVVNGDTAENGETVAAIANRYVGALSSVWARVFALRQAGPR